MTRSLRIETPADFDFGWVTAFLAPRAVASLERVTAESFDRIVRLDRGVVRLTVRCDGSALRVSASPSLAPAELRLTISRLLDLSGDAERFRAHVATDDVLGPIVSRHVAVRLPQLLDPFEGLVRAMLGQQVSVRAASTLTDRLVRLLGERISDDDDGPTHAFPAAAVVADASVETLRALGIPRVRAASLRAASEALRDGVVTWEALRAMSASDAQRALDDLPGVGPWTASYVRMRALGDRDAFPASDLGVVKAMARAGVSAAAIEARSDAWRPWRGYAAVHLWASLGDQ